MVSIETFDINGDGVPELITGWSTGKVDARIYSTGEVMFKIQLSSGVAGIVEADYRRTGKPDLVMVSAHGEGEQILRDNNSEINSIDRSRDRGTRHNIIDNTIIHFYTRYNNNYYK